RSGGVLSTRLQLAQPDEIGLRLGNVAHQDPGSQASVVGASGVRPLPSKSCGQWDGVQNLTGHPRTTWQEITGNSLGRYPAQMGYPRNSQRCLTPGMGRSHRTRKTALGGNM